jgi:hypothetical protein
VFVTAYWAARGNRWASLGFLALTLVMPRPVQVPLALWLLWSQPAVRWPFLALFAAHAGLVLLSGQGEAWAHALTSVSAGEANMASNYGLSRILGTAWPFVGIPLAFVLFRRHPALAGLVLSPYLLAQYWLFVLVDLPRGPNSRHERLPSVDGAGGGRPLIQPGWPQRFRRLSSIQSHAASQ